MDFYRVIGELGLANLLTPICYNKPDYAGWNKVYESLLDIWKNKRKCFLYGDYDVDGLMCVLTLYEGLRSLGIEEIEIYNYKERTHSLDAAAVQECIQRHYDYFIICDTGSNEEKLVNLLTGYGIKVIILDHHSCNKNYDDFTNNVAIINTEIENRIAGFDKYNLSAGALCYTVVDCFASEIGREYNKSIVAYATISLYSDCVGMKNQLNRAIYYRSKALTKDELPWHVTDFMNKWVSFNARYIGFWFAPRINSLFRAEQFLVLNNYFFNCTQEDENRNHYITVINNLYQFNRKLVNMLTDLIEPKELENFVVADLASVYKYNEKYIPMLHNYTGLVANQLSDRFNKTAVVYCQFENGYKGSVRDLYGRNYLGLFKTLCCAEGHNAAFGLKINIFDLKKFLVNLNLIDQRYSIQSITNEPLVIDYPYSYVDEILLNDIALFNEFASTDVPVVLIKKQIVGDIREKLNPYNYKYLWDGDYVIQSDYQLSFGSTVLIKPIYSGSLKLLAQ